MDELMDQGFPIPSNKPMFGDEGEGAGKTFAAFVNDAGDKAVVLATAEVNDGEVISRIPEAELEAYAQDLMDDGVDDRGLQIGATFEGDTAEADAESEAMRLNQEFTPADDSDEALAEAVESAKGGPVEPFPEDEGADELEVPIDEEIEEPDEEVDELEEPMLDQLKKKARDFGE